MDYIHRRGIERATRAMLRHPCVFFIQGFLGIGKTTLLKHLERNAENQRVHNIVYVDLSKILGETFRTKLPGSSISDIQEEAACQVIQALAEHIPAKETLDAIQKRSKLSLEVAYDSEIRTLLGRLGGNALLNIGFKALTEGFKTVPLVGSLLDTAHDALSKEEIQHTLIRVVTRRARHEEALLLFDPLQVLTDALIEDLKIFANREKKIVVLIDDFREDLSLLKNWFLKLLCILPEGLNASWFFSTWGQKDSTWTSLNWDFTERRVQRLEYAVVEDILSARMWSVWRTVRHFPAYVSPPLKTYTSLGPVTGKKPGLIESIEKKGRRLDFLPLILAEADNRASDRQCCEVLSDHLKRWLVDPQQFDWVRNIAVTRFFDREIVDYLVDNAVEYNCWQQLVKVGRDRFLIPRGDRYSLQPELRYALLRYTQTQHSMRSYFDLHEKIANFYRNKILAFSNSSDQESGLLLPYPLLSPWAWYVEWFYHGLSASARPGEVLLEGLQRALLNLLTEHEKPSQLIDVIYQVADERHSERDFLTEPIPFPLSTSKIGRRNSIPQSYERGFRKWGEILEECLQKVQKPHGADWNSIVNFFDTFIDLGKLDPDCISPRAVAEALLWRALAAYEMQEDDPAPEDHLKDIASLCKEHEDPWWEETKNLADICKRGLKETGYWQWDQFP